MSNETASLVIVVDSTGVAKATEQLDALAAAGARAEAAVGAGGLTAAADSVAAIGPAAATAGAGMSTVAEASAAVEASVTKASQAVNAFGETAAMVDARHKAIAASYAEQAAAGGQIVLSERAIAEATGARVELTDAEIASIQAAVAAQDAQMTSMEAFVGVEKAATVAAVETTAATEVQAVAFKANSRVVSESATIMSEALSGNFGRMKRSFAALANASGVLGKLFTPMGFAIAGAAAAIGLLVTAVVEGSNEQDKLTNSIRSTGDYAGVTAGQVRVMADALTSTRTSTMQATDMLSSLVATGKVSGNTLQELAQASVDLSEVTGISAEKASEVFIRMQSDPVKAVKALDDQLHFLTLTQYENIKALQEQGDTELAAAIAQTAAASALHDRAVAQEADVGSLTSYFHGLESAAKAAWGAVANVGAPGSNTQDLAAANADLAGYKRNAGLPASATDAELLATIRNGASSGGDSETLINGAISRKAQAQAGADMESWVAQTDSSAAKTNDILKKDSDRWDTILKSAKSDQAKAKEIADVKAMTQRDIAGNPNNRDEYLKDQDIALAAIEKKYKQPAASAGVASRAASDPSANALATFQGQVNALDVKSITADDPALTQYEQGIANLADQMNVYMAKGHDATQAAALFNQGQQDLQKTLDLNRAKQDEANQAFDQAYAKKSQALQRSIDDQVNAVGMGAKEIQRTQEISKAYADEADALANLALQRQKGQRGESGGISQDQYEHDVQTVKASTNANVAAMQDGFKRIDAAQGSWLNGAKSAMKDYADAGANVAGMTAQVFGNAFTSMGDALATFATTGKLNFKGLVTSIISDLARMEARVLESQALSAVLGMFTGVSYGGGAGAATGTGQYSNFASSGTQTVSYNAKGGVYGSPSLSAYSGQIVSQPTMFAFAKGAGIMGEEGDEAIMPLTRGSDGKLGVQAVGGGSNSGGVQVVIENHTDVQPKVTQSTGSNGESIITVLMKQVDDRMAANAGNPTSNFGKAMQRTYNVRRAGVPVGG